MWLEGSCRFVSLSASKPGLGDGEGKGRFWFLSVSCLPGLPLLGVKERNLQGQEHSGEGLLFLHYLGDRYGREVMGPGGHLGQSY